ncbi:hypothetical protein ACHAW5_011113 [Stephanodiscus triporus]|uniref:OTU domain-containing protein n=1 Tax=Stephanodiscus triporus TaxID=2934178 RepID=A0ABD3MFL5_9STRA
MAPNTRGKRTRKDATAGRRNDSPPSPPLLLGPHLRRLVLLLLASWFVLHDSPAAKGGASRIRRRHHEVRAEQQHHRRPTTIPRSNNRYAHYRYSGSSSSSSADGASEASGVVGGDESETPPRFHPPWNPSPKIDPNGFLSDAYARCPGEWESLANIRGRHGPRAGGGGGRRGGGGILLLNGGNNKNNKKDRRRADDDYDDDDDYYFNELLNVPVLVRQVPGDGNCLFHSISACLHHAANGTHLPMNSHERVRRLRESSLRLRNAAVDVLQQRQRRGRTWGGGGGGGGWTMMIGGGGGGGGRRLFLQGEEYLDASELLSAAAAQFDLTGEEYCELMRKECYWGGGPEIVALYEVIPVDESAAHRRVNGRGNSKYSLLLPSSRRGGGSNNDDVDVKKLSTNKQFALRRMACFGSPKFDRREPLHILSADSRFPDVDPHRIRRVGNHFMALFPVVDLSSCKVDTGGDGGVRRRFARHALIGRGGCRTGSGVR